MAEKTALFVTCLANILRPETGLAAAGLLERAGHDLVVPRDQTCCGQPNYNSGDMAGARAIAKATIAVLEPFEAVVVPSASCAGMIINHYPALLVDEPDWSRRARDLAIKTQELFASLGPVDGEAGTTAVAMHDSCASLRELTARPPMREHLKAAGFAPKDLPLAESCCGFGGSFAVKLPELSLAMADDKLDQLVATGAKIVTSCDLGCLLHLESRAKARGLELEFAHAACLVERGPAA